MPATGSMTGLGGGLWSAEAEGGWPSWQLLIGQNRLPWLAGPICSMVLRERAAGPGGEAWRGRGRREAGHPPADMVQGGGGQRGPAVTTTGATLLGADGRGWHSGAQITALKTGILIKPNPLDSLREPENRPPEN